MSADVGLALRVAQCFMLLGRIRAEALVALEGDHEGQQKAPEATVKLKAAHAQHLREVGGDLIVPSNLGRHLSFGQYCDLHDIVNDDLPEIEAGIQHKIEEIGKSAKTPGTLGFEDLLAPEIAQAALPLYRMGDYRGAVIRACEVLITVIRDRTGLKLDGTALTNQVFKQEGGLLVIAHGADETAPNQRAGLADLMRGTMAAIRNVYVHDPKRQPKPEMAARHLALLSTLVHQAQKAEPATAPIDI